jgi:hypothetical protein
MSDTPRTDDIWFDTSRKYSGALASSLYDLSRELERENAALREKDEDWENAVLHARDHRCDEAHCTCVVPLLGKINQLERENVALGQSLLIEEERSMYWRAAEDKLKRENASLRAALDQQANYHRELRADRDRLDWLARNRSVSRIERPLSVTPESLRAAIDAAREAQP